MRVQEVKQTAGLLFVLVAVFILVVFVFVLVFILVIVRIFVFVLVLLGRGEKRIGAQSDKQRDLVQGCRRDNKVEGHGISFMWRGESLRALHAQIARV